MVRRGYAEFASKIAMEAGLAASYGAFSASMTARLDSSAVRRTDAWFARVQATCHSKVLSIGESTRALGKHVTRKFRAALRDDTADAILDSFGTHVAVKVQYGGRCSYLMSSTASTELTETQFAARAKAKYGPVSGEVKANLATSSRIEASECATTLEAYGGDPSLVQAGADDKLQYDQFTSWERSVADDPGFLGFTKDGLVPIWELAGSRRDELFLAFQRRVALNPVVHVFEQTSSAAEWPEAEVVLPRGYKVVGGGAQVNHAVNWGRPGMSGNHLIASYPTSGNSWYAQSKSHLKPTATTITTFAIGLYDPAALDLWDVVIKEEAGEERGSVGGRDAR